jgi:hypothetical protein
MNPDVLILLAIALLAANLPFMSERIGFVKRPAAGDKAFGWRLLEGVALYFAVGGIAWLIESRRGPVHAQHWEFHAVTAALFIVFAYPGFVARYLWRKRGA